MLSLKDFNSKKISCHIGQIVGGKVAISSKESGWTDVPTAHMMNCSEEQNTTTTKYDDGEICQSTQTRECCG